MKKLTRRIRVGIALSVLAPLGLASAPASACAERVAVQAPAQTQRAEGPVIAQTVARPTQQPSVGHSAAFSGYRPAGNWTLWGYRHNRAETAVIASISLWQAVSGIKATKLIPYSAVIIGLYSYSWVLAARNAKAMGQCLGITYSGTGIWVNCTS
jgi:hypothetical protein